MAAPTSQADITAAAKQGRIVIVGTLAGAVVDVPLFALMAKRLAVHGTVLRARTIEEKAAAAAAFVDEVGPLLDDGRVRPIVDRILPLEDALEAYDLLTSDATFGKVILRARTSRSPRPIIGLRLPGGRRRILKMSHRGRSSDCDCRGGRRRIPQA